MPKHRLDDLPGPLTVSHQSADHPYLQEIDFPHLTFKYWFSCHSQTLSHFWADTAQNFMGSWPRFSSFTHSVALAIEIQELSYTLQSQGSPLILCTPETNAELLLTHLHPYANFNTIVCELKERLCPSNLPNKLTFTPCWTVLEIPSH